MIARIIVELEGSGYFFWPASAVRVKNFVPNCEELYKSLGVW
jgi:hypothetical protein